jgi:hypothetical protein
MAKGVKTGGGSRKGKPNKATAAQARAVAESGQTPLDYLLDVMRNGEDPAMRLDAAKAAAPYVHPKLQPVDGQDRQLRNKSACPSRVRRYSSLGVSVPLGMSAPTMGSRFAIAPSMAAGVRPSRTASRRR